MTKSLPRGEQPNRTCVSESLQLVIEDLSHEAAAGVARDAAGRVFFVRGALPEETVRIEVGQRRRGIYEGRLLEVLHPSPLRVKPPCAHFGSCGGCALQHLSEEGQLYWKQKQVEEALWKIAHFKPSGWLPPVQSHEYGYRRKARLGVRQRRDQQRVYLGFRHYKGRYLNEVQHCSVVDDRLQQAWTSLEALLNGWPHRASVPQIEWAAGTAGAALVVRHLKPVPDEDWAPWVLFSQQFRIAIYSQGGGPKTLKRIFPEHHVIEDEQPLFKTVLAAGPLDFLQVHADINQQLVREVVTTWFPNPEATYEAQVLDLFCGLGNFTLALATRSLQGVTGVEGESSMVEQAIQNGARQKEGVLKTPVRFLRANLFEPIASEPWYDEACTHVHLDPPRAGAESVVQHLSKDNWPSLRHLAYVSCHAASFARDVAILVHKQRFQMVSIRIANMFPHTQHVETLAFFER